MPWTPLPANPTKGFQDLAFLNEYVLATRERTRAGHLTAHPALLAGGEQIQRLNINGSLISILQLAIENAVGRYLKADPTESSSGHFELWTVTALGEALHGPGATSPWRRYTTHPDDGGVVMYGRQQTGDIMHGLWIFEDLQAALNLLTRTIYYRGNWGGGSTATLPLWGNRNTGVGGQTWRGEEDEFTNFTNAADAMASAEADWQMVTDSASLNSPPDREADVGFNSSTGFYTARLGSHAAEHSVQTPPGFRNASLDGGAITRHARVGFWIRAEADGTWDDQSTGLTEDTWTEYDSHDDFTVAPGDPAFCVSNGRWPPNVATMPTWPASTPGQSGFFANDEIPELGSGSANGAIVFDWAVPGGFKYIL